MPGSNEVRASEVSPIERMTQVVRYGAQKGKAVIQTAGQLGTLAVTTGLSQFSQGVSAQNTEDSAPTNATTFIENPTNQFYMYGGLGLIGAMVITVVFIYPLFKRLCCHKDDAVRRNENRVSVREFNAFVDKHSGKSKVTHADAVVQVDVDVHVPLVTETHVEIDVEAQRVSFSVGSERSSMVDDAAALSTPTVVELNEAYDDDLAVLVDDRQQKKEELGRVKRATRILERMIARPEQAQALSVKYRDLLSSVS